MSDVGRGRAGEGVLRVVQLNAGTLLEPGWDERRHEVVAWLDHLAPDVVCLQEVWESPSQPNTAGWIAEAVPGAGWHWCFEGRPFAESLWPDPDMRFGSAVLSRWPIDEVAYHPLPVADGADPMVGGVPWELVHARTAGLDVFSCHLAAAPRDAPHRRRQVLAIDEIVTAASGDGDERVGLGKRRAGMPPIICGDFNAEPDSDEIRFLCGFTPLDGRTAYYQDAWRVAGDGPGHTQDWRTHPLAAGLNVPRKRIDYVFVGDAFLRQGDAGRVLSADLAFHRPRAGTLASDHAGLVVDVVWPGRPAG